METWMSGAILIEATLLSFLVALLDRVNEPARLFRMLPATRNESNVASIRIAPLIQVSIAASLQFLAQWSGTGHANSCHIENAVLTGHWNWAGRGAGYTLWALERGQFARRQVS